MIITVNVVKAFIEGLDLSSRVLSHSNNGTNTTIQVGNVFHARPALVVDIDGSNYTVISADYSTNTLVVAGVIALPLLLTVPIPFYWHGTFMKLKNELNQILSIDDKVPMIYLHEIVREVRKNPSRTDIRKISDITLFFMDKAPELGATTSQQYADIITPLEKTVDLFCDSLYADRKFSDMGDIMQVNEIEWGNYTDKKGHLKTFFDARLSGIALSFALPILKCCD